MHRPLLADLGILELENELQDSKIAGGVDGLTAIERIAAFPTPPRMVALTTFDVDDYVLRALRAGAAGFLLKSTAPEDIVGAAGDRQRARDLIGSLTEREGEVLACLGAGRSNQQIARLLHLSEATVKGYVLRLLVKLGCDNRTQAGRLAHRAGLDPSVGPVRPAQPP